ncbi:MAG: AMP-binding protein [Treponema sp.]|nr:AMP-binding protein [Candidatus Treponema scatequi]
MNYLKKLFQSQKIFSADNCTDITKIFSSYEDIQNKFQIPVSDNFNFTRDVVDYYAQVEPQKRALVWCNDDGEEKIFSFEDISRDSKKTAQFLIDNGIKKGDVVMLMLRRRYEFWYFMVACHRIGAIAIPATVQLTDKDIEYRVRSSGAKLIVTIDDENVNKEIDSALDLISRAGNTIDECKKNNFGITTDAGSENSICRKITLSQFHKTFDNTNFALYEIPPETKNSDTMVVFFTSGTSGEPKMVAHNFLYPLGHIVTALFWQRVSDGGLHLTLAETGWAKALWGKLYGQWICGSAVFVYDFITFKPDNVLEKIEKYKVTTFCAPPTIYRYLIRTDFSKHDITSLTHCTTAGESLSEEVSETFFKKTNLKIHEAYGQTEATVIIGNFFDSETKPGSMGKASPCYDVIIENENGDECAPNEKGQVVVKLDKKIPLGLFSGYYNDEEKTRAVFSDKKYYTGDTAYRDEDGYFFYCGRGDDVIKSAGFRISPYEVEKVLASHPAVMECLVCGIPDEKRGQVVKAMIVLNDGFEPGETLAREIQEYVFKRIALYKRPRVVEFVKSLPKTVSDKIVRKKV